MAPNLWKQTLEKDTRPGSIVELSFLISATKRGSERSGSKIRSFLSHPIHCESEAYARSRQSKARSRQNMTMQRPFFQVLHLRHRAGPIAGSRIGVRDKCGNEGGRLHGFGFLQFRDGVAGFSCLDIDPPVCHLGKEVCRIEIRSPLGLLPRPLVFALPRKRKNIVNRDLRGKGT